MAFENYLGQRDNTSHRHKDYKCKFFGLELKLPEAYFKFT